MRTRDIIDVVIPDGPTFISQADAWDNLVRVVSERHGVDLNGPNPFRVLVLPISSKGNHRMSALFAYPKSCTKPEDVMANAAMSLFGEMTEALSECAPAHADLMASAAPVSAGGRSRLR